MPLTFPDTGAEDGGGQADPLSRRPAWVEVDLDALRHNLETIRRRVEPASVLAIVKADAYGHGAVAVARCLASAGVDWLGVALIEEGVALRQAGIETPILVLGTMQEEEIAVARRHRLVAAVSSREQLRMWIDAAAGGGADERLDLHLKLDTGMNRLGLAEADWSPALDSLAGQERLRLAGLLSHFSESEILDSGRSDEQERVLERALELFAPLIERDHAVVHLANSAAALHRPSSRRDLVRAGLAVYGIDPAGREDELRPVMSVRARVVQMRSLTAGQAVGYGGLWRAARASRVGIVPIGYADGYSWRLGGRARVLVDGRSAPVIGAVSMDMLAVDLTDTTADVSSEITLVGESDDRRIGVVELAELAGTTPYELLCHFGLRLARRYPDAAAEVTATENS